MRKLFAVFLITTMCACDATDHACTEIGCDSHLALVLRPSIDRRFAGGVYEIEATLDGQISRCTFTVDAAGGIPAEDCNASYYLYGADHAVEIRYSEATSVRFVVRHGGVARATSQLTPEYHLVEPNGPSCGPVCRQADISISL